MSAARSASSAIGRISPNLGRGRPSPAPTTATVPSASTTSSAARWSAVVPYTGCVGARRVVGDHAAQGGPRRGCHIRAEPQTVRVEKGVELVENDSRPNADRPRLEVEVRDSAIVARKIHHQPAAESAPREPGARPPRRDFDTAAGSCGEQHRGFPGRAREGHRCRFDAIDGGIHRVQAPGESIRPDLATRVPQPLNLWCGQVSHRGILQRDRPGAQSA